MRDRRGFFQRPESGFLCGLALAVGSIAAFTGDVRGTAVALFIAGWLGLEYWSSQ